MPDSPICFDFSEMAFARFPFFFTGTSYLRIRSADSRSAYQHDQRALLEAEEIKSLARQPDSSADLGPARPC